MRNSLTQLSNHQTIMPSSEMMKHSCKTSPKKKGRRRGLIEELRSIVTAERGGELIEEGKLKNNVQLSALRK